jgi:pilus assembly protein Flp/PilA
MQLIKNLWNDESGQGLTEYAVIIALVAVGLLLVLIAFREAIAQVFRDTTSELGNATVNQAQP